MEDIVYAVEEKDEGMILRDFLTKKGLSKTLIKRAKPGGLSVSGEVVTVRRVLKLGDTVRVTLPRGDEENIEPMDIPLRVVYEDDALLVADKPTNMPTHPSRGNSLPTLANAVAARMGRGFVFRAITRLDRDTSGLVLIAKDAFSAQRLSESMKRGEILKKYRCRVVGVPSPECGTVDAPIRREAPDSIKRTVAEDGKRAITEYRVLAACGDSSLCEINLITGRTHQIRVHMAHIGHPLVSDFLYGERTEKEYYLRCIELTFPHPITREILTLSADTTENV